MLLIYSSKHYNTVMLYEFITFTEKLIQFSEESCKIEVMTERELAAEEIAKATDIIADFIYPRFVRLDSAKDLKNVKSKIFSIQLNFIFASYQFYISYAYSLDRGFTGRSFHQSFKAKNKPFSL